MTTNRNLFSSSTADTEVHDFAKDNARLEADMAPYEISRPDELVRSKAAVPVAPVAPFPGRKDDTAKLDMTLLWDMPHALEGVCEVLQWAITKKEPVPYKRGSWQAVQPFQLRYSAASMRHELNLAKRAIDNPGDHPELARDPETGLLELAHIATNAMFRLEMAVRKIKGIV